MVNCFVPNCKHFSKRDKCSYFRFPKDEKLKKIWIKNIRRADQSPSNSARVCSCHFENGMKENIPTIFQWNEHKIMNFPSPEKRKRRKTTCNEETVPVQPVSPRPSSIASYLAEIDTLKQENIRIKKEIEDLKTHPFSYELIKNDQRALKYYTGLIFSEIFEIILSMCTEDKITYYAGLPVTSMKLEDQLLLTLMKLKLNLGHFDLARRFNVSSTTVSNIFLTWLHVLHQTIFEDLMSEIPSMHKNRTCLLACFENFENCRMVLDCTEIFTHVPKNLDHQKKFYSSDKHRNTMKALVAVAPNGIVNYISNLYPGATSDKEVLGKCKELYSILEPGDLVIADKGFLISDLVPAEVTVNVPPFLFNPQFTPSEVVETNNIARAQIHVERAIRRIKIYQIVRLIPKTLFQHATKVFQVCAALTNFRGPLLKEVEESYSVEDDCDT